MAIEPAVAGYTAGQLPLVSVIEAVQALWLVQAISLRRIQNSVSHGRVSDAPLDHARRSSNDTTFHTSTNRSLASAAATAILFTGALGAACAIGVAICASA